MRRAGSTIAFVLTIMGALSACSEPGVLDPPAPVDSQSSARTETQEDSANQNGISIHSLWAPPSGDERAILTESEARKIIATLVETAPQPADGQYLNIDSAVEDALQLNKQQPPDSLVDVAFLSRNIASIQIPYNPEWISEKHLLPPYYAHENGISFGPLVYNWHGFAIFRTMALEIREARPASAALSEAQENQFQNYEPLPPPAIIRIGDFEAVEYVTEPPESAPITILEIAAPSYNYVFTCWSDGYGYASAEPQACDRMREIARSMELTE